MITSSYDHAYVWVWLPGATQPIVAGKLENNTSHYDFFYGQSYLQNQQAIALSAKELPLLSNQRFKAQKQLHFAFQDALPDAWGRRILHHYYAGFQLSALDMLLLSSSDRIGALHFQTTADEYVPRYENHATLEELLAAAELVEKGQAIPKALAIALNHGTSIGGARPKATIATAHKKFIAKFSSSSDLFPIVQAEYAAMWLAKRIGLDVANVELVEVKGRYVLLVQRFDRELVDGHWQRKFLFSALSLLALDENEGRYASYLDIADEIRHQCVQPKATLKELFRRMVFNILIGNTDDHAKNHSFFWDGSNFQLTPAYDICPYPRVGQEATQAMVVGKNGAFSQLSNVLSAAEWFDIPHTEAKDMIDELTLQVTKQWPHACDKARLTSIQQQQLTRTAVLNPFIFF